MPSAVHDTKGVTAKKQKKVKESTLETSVHSDTSRRRNPKTKTEAAKQPEPKNGGLPTNGASNFRSIALSPPSPSWEGLNSLQEFLEQCQVAKEQKWTETLSLAAIRRRLGLPMRKENLSDDEIEHLKTLYVAFIKDIQMNQEESALLEPLFESSTEHPDGAIVLLQFLQYTDVAPHDPVMVRVADMIAKDLSIGGWCREVLRFPDDFQDVILECALAHLQRITYITDAQQRLEFILTCILRDNDDPVDGLNELREDLVKVVSREGGAGCMTITRSLYFHNSIETMLFGKNDENPMLDDQIDVFEEALEGCQDSFPSNFHFQRALDQLSPACSWTYCYKRGSFSCCDFASYCCQECRDNHWKEHKKECQNGKDNKVEIDFSVPDDVGSMPQGDFSSDEEEDAHAMQNGHSAFESGFEEELNSLPWEGDIEAEPSPPVPQPPPVQQPKPKSNSGLLAGNNSFTSVTTDYDQMFQPLASTMKPAQFASRPAEPSDALIKQDGLLGRNPSIDYFILQPWGNIGLQLKSPVDKEFQSLRLTAKNSPSHEVVGSMFRILLHCCPYLKEDIRSQLEEEYELNLGGPGRR